MPENQVCTVVSIVPTYLNLDIVGIFPGSFRIPAADDDKPEVLYVGDSVHYVYLGADRGMFKVKDLAADVCKSIVNDFKKSIICSNPGAEPGLFWMDGEVKNVEKECAIELKNARELQKKWYVEMINMADDDWQRSGHIHKTISNLQRLIAKKLGMDKEWLYQSDDDVAMGSLKCPACKIIIDKDSVLCNNCKLILKPDEFRKLTFAHTV